MFLFDVFQFPSMVRDRSPHNWYGMLLVLVAYVVLRYGNKCLNKNYFWGHSSIMFMREGGNGGRRGNDKGITLNL